MKSKNHKRRVPHSSVDKHARVKKQSVPEQSKEQPVFGFIDEIEWERAEGVAGPEKPPREVLLDPWAEDWIFGGLGLDEGVPPQEVEEKKESGQKKLDAFPEESLGQKTPWEEHQPFGYSHRPHSMQEEWQAQPDVEEYPPSYDEASQLHFAQKGLKARKKQRSKIDRKKRARD